VLAGHAQSTKGSLRRTECLLRLLALALLRSLRRQFSVMIGTLLERATGASEHVGTCRSRVQLRDKGGNLPAEIGVSYRTVPRMRDIIKRAARDTKGIDWISERCLLAS